MNRETMDTTSMLGKEYPFFLGNDEFGEMYYSYQIYSPGISEDGEAPLVSFTKVNERVEKTTKWGNEDPKGKLENKVLTPIMPPNGKDSDILHYLIGPKKEKKQYTGFIKTLIRKEGVEVTQSGDNFPFFKMIFGDRCSLQKTIIIHLRDALRWKSYIFRAGKKVELLYSPTEFIVFEFKETEDQELYLEPIAAYKNYDVEMRNPLKVNFDVINYPKGKWSTSTYSEMNRAFKLYEWECFTRREIAPRLRRRL